MPPSSRPFAHTAMAFAKRANAASAGAAAAGNASAAAAEKQSLANDRLRSFRRVVRSRVSARRFEPRAVVPDRVWRDILEMTRTSPSGFNLQPTHVLLLRSPVVKATLSKHAMLGLGNRHRTDDASAVAVFCADLRPSERIDRIYDMERGQGGGLASGSSSSRPDGYLAVMRAAASFLTGEGSTTASSASATTSTSNSNGGSSGGSSTHLSTLLKRTFADALSPVQPMPTMERAESWSYKNAGISAQTYAMAATAHGLSTCMMEGYDARRVKEILRIPERYGVPLMVATGYDYGAKKEGDAVHADLDGEEDASDDDDDDDDDGPLKVERTARLDMDELFFGDTFGEPLDLLRDDRGRY